MKKIAVIVCLALLAACKNDKIENSEKSKAYIFERRSLPGNRLLVSYSYRAGDQIEQDSCIIDNKVIDQDSIAIDVLAKNSLPSYSFRQ